MPKPICIIGYSGHGYVAADIFLKNKLSLKSYCDSEEKKINPFDLQYLGSEAEENVLKKLKDYDYFISIGNNKIRQKIYNNLFSKIGNPINAIHPSAIINAKVDLGFGIMIAANATINSLSKIGDGVVLNTNCVVEHECVVGDFSFIAPSAVLCGDVTIGKNSFVGANAVIIQGIKIGDDVTIGAGSVIKNNIPDGTTVVGNPAQVISK